MESGRAQALSSMILAAISIYDLLRTSRNELITQNKHISEWVKRIHKKVCPVAAVASRTVGRILSVFTSTCSCF